MKNNYSKFLLEFSLSIKKSVKFNYYVLAMLFALSISFTSNGQAIIRYQNEIKGGTTKTGNTFDSGATSGTSGFPTHSHTLLDLDADATTIRSTSADLVLPANSTIVKAYLYLETSGPFFLNDFKFKVPGQTNYSVIPLTDALSNSGTSYNQVVFDVTKYITSPTTMYSTSSAGGTGGRYWVADVKNNTNGTYSHSYGGGWTLQIVYSNPNSKYRHVL
ncbi:hypothetical protein P3875_09235 [Myroides sp. JBRI-B21084]|uniref:hypothetical protein n=1 Tax=Myroides sp. JBRI-B21084 TaxID=3119977 RepID=UPI0026E453A2|nr:hypothetical protein [Paenimyroides cloacae]WKW45960.1 hypothetical protein P3875_09235 [Paenimyroides cloacae]